MRLILLSLILYIALAESKPAEPQDTLSTELATLDGVYDGPVAFTFVTSSSMMISERSSISQLDLETNTKKLLIGSVEKGGYLDGPALEARFTLINDITAIGNYVYIADFGCVRVYDISREQVGTLAGSCGYLDTITTTVIPPTFRGHLKLAVAGRDVYVLDGDRVMRVDRETGVSWLLSAGEYLSPEKGICTSIDVDRFTNVLYITTITEEGTKLVAVDGKSGKQTLYRAVPQQLKHQSLTAKVASLAISPSGELYILEPTAIHSVSQSSLDVTSKVLDAYGYHEIAVSSEYLILSQEFYSRMYRLHVIRLQADKKVETDEPHGNEDGEASQTQQQETLKNSIQLFERQIFYLAVVFPSCLFLLVIVVTVCAARKILRRRSKEDAMSTRSQTESEILSEKYLLNSESNAHWI